MTSRTFFEKESERCQTARTIENTLWCFLLEVRLDRTEIFQKSFMFFFFYDEILSRRPNTFVSSIVSIGTSCCVHWNNSLES